MEMEKEPVEKEEKEQSRTEKQNVLTEKRSRDNPYLEDKKGKRSSWERNKILFKNNQKTMSRFNKKDVVHNKENEATEQRGQRNFYKEERRNSGEEKEGTAYSKTLEEKLEKILQLAKVVQKKQLAVGDWLPLQKSQLQNNQPKGPGNLGGKYGKNGKGLKRKRVRENELGNQEEDKENRKEN
ncbi:22758_t:CDS:2, partial [Gigaspora rosea]